MVMDYARPEDLDVLILKEIAKTLALSTWRGTSSKFWAFERYLMSIVEILHTNELPLS